MSAPPSHVVVPARSEVVFWSSVDSNARTHARLPFSKIAAARRHVSRPSVQPLVSYHLLINFLSPRKHHVTVGYRSLGHFNEEAKEGKKKAGSKVMRAFAQTSPSSFTSVNVCIYFFFLKKKETKPQCACDQAM